MIIATAKSKTMKAFKIAYLLASITGKEKSEYETADDIREKRLIR